MSDKWDAHDGHTHSSPEHHHKTEQLSYHRGNIGDLPPVTQEVIKNASIDRAPQIHARFKLGEDARVPCHQPKKDGNGWEQVNGLRVKLYPVTGEPFGSATPSGELTMVIANPEAIKVFAKAELGQEYDVIFTPVKKAE